MIKYLLISLIFKIILFNYAFGQIITVTQRGTQIISVEFPDKIPDTTLALQNLTVKEDSIRIKFQTEIDLKNKIN